MGQGRIFAILAALNDFAIGIQFHQLMGHLLNALFNVRGRPTPTRSPQLDPFSAMAFRAFVSLDLIEAVQADIQCVARRRSCRTR